MSVLAALLTGVAVACAVAGPSTRRLPGASDGAGWREAPTAALGCTLGAVVLACWWILTPTGFVLVLILLATLLGVLAVMRRRAAARAADRRSDQVLATCEAIASDLAAGQPPLLSLAQAAADWPDFAPVAVAGQLGADVPDALRELAQRPGAGQLRTLAASWYVAHDTGAGLAAAVSTAAAGIRADRRTARLVAAELASARATARVLAVLPVGVLLLGLGVGGDPIGFLTGSPVGLGCLGLGLAFSFAGVRWLDSIADRVQRR